MTLWLVVALVVVMVVGPALYLLPSPRERQVTRLRGRAMGQGVVVKLTSIPHPDPQPEDRVSPGGQVREPRLDTVAWRLPVRARDDRHQAPAFRLLKRPGDAHPDLPAGWTWETVDRAPDSAFVAALAPLLADLPASSHAVEVAPDSVALLWRETGDEARADALVQTLLALAGLVEERIRRPPASPGDEGG